MDTDNSSSRWANMSPLKKIGSGVGILLAVFVGCGTLAVQSDNRALEALPPAERTATIEAREAKRTEKAASKAPEDTEEPKPTDAPKATEKPPTELPTDEPSETPAPTDAPTATETDTPKPTDAPTLTSMPPTAVPATAAPIVPTDPPAPPPAPTDPPAAPAAPAAPSGCVDINRAPREALVNIINIGEKRVDDLIRLRPYNSVKDLSRISGISRTGATMQEILAQGLACVIP